MDYLFVLASEVSAIGAAPYLNAMSYTFRLQKIVRISLYKTLSTRNQICLQIALFNFILHVLLEVLQQWRKKKSPLKLMVVLQGFRQ